MCFMVHLEERNNPENLQWDVRKTQSEILHFHSLWQVREEIMITLCPLLLSLNVLIYTVSSLFEGMCFFKGYICFTLYIYNSRKIK